MNITSLIIFLAVGALAGIIMNGLIGDVIVGVIGAVLGGFIFVFFGKNHTPVNESLLISK